MGQLDIFGDDTPPQAGIGEVLYKGKPAEQLTRKELIECARHLRDAHIKLTHTMAAQNRRIDELEEKLRAK
jgi:hypothetical protein